MENISIFGFEALWSPYFFLFITGCTCFYFFLINRKGDKFRKRENVSPKQMMYFTAAMVFIYALKGSPLDLLSHLMFSAHMIQMALLYLLVPPLLIAGIPVWMWKRFTAIPGIRQIFTFFTKPLLALILFNGLFSLYHFPAVFDFLKSGHFFHSAASIFLFFSALCMWWPLFNKFEDKNKLNGLMKIGYIFANGMLLTPACALIIFSKTPLYLTYSDPASWMHAMQLCVPSGTLSGLNLSGPEMFNSLPVMDDQQLGGVAMKIIQEIIYGAVLASVFFNWAKEEREKDKKEEEAYKAHL
ncbi:cytochrome c oxidase assembly factor CtaG [Metabacillus sp. GX 13764]|uniref:cytochrome c oxidase assembly factor CtaG n=1 Tax=Metabacillus kandeliae TaxID=2900151 RepID=UPI001E31DB49|nr:cytochrome c oxidase assembly factor CtaG [Metabacillus kandeliae]MCD7033928.1 cytochrome c oxidase assembly factor CtaG [Metabacillus kandeliae]